MSEEYAILGAHDPLPPKGKLRWQCRRGMKELEVLLLPFLEHCYDQWSESEQRLFIRLLGFDDASLFAWFMGYEQPEDSGLADVIKRVHSAVADLLSDQSRNDSAR